MLVTKKCVVNVYRHFYVVLDAMMLNLNTLSFNLGAGVPFTFFAMTMFGVYVHQRAQPKYAYRSNKPDQDSEQFGGH